VALAAVEAAAIAAFVGATIAAATPLRAALGPMWDYVWIWHAGVSGAWTIGLAGRRLIAAADPALRLAALGDAGAAALERRLRLGVAVGLGGWLAAGLFPTLGAGIGPAILAVLTSVTGVALWLVAAALRAQRSLAAHAAALIGVHFRTLPAAVAHRAAQAAPVLLAVYLIAAGAYWAVHWLESGVQRLAGPLGAAAMALVLPTLDRAAEGQAARRLAGLPNGPALLDALRAIWRSALAAMAVLGGFALWGVDAATLLRGPAATAWSGAVVDLVAVLAVAWLAWRLARAALPDGAQADVAADGDEGGVAAPGARRATLAPLLRGVMRVMLVALAAFSILSSLGVDVAPLVASAGVVGIAIGFGAQTLVRDVFSGLFFIADDAFRLGEYVEFDGGLKGTVEAISLRSLRLRHHLGGVITVPFGELRSVTNQSRDWVIFRLDFRMEPETDPAAVKQIVRALGADLAADAEHGPKLIEPPKSQGVFMIDDDSALVMRVKFKCRPGAQWVLRRELYHRLTRAFAVNGVRLARRKVEVVGTPLAEVAAAGA
jgi:small-conductance mechanosensitive channel